MEPRPQRPRSTPGRGQQPGAAQSGRSASPQPGYPAGPAEGFVDDYDEQPFIAPPRTEYDYSPLDLAPPGQRRRRQFVAAAIGALALLMVAAIAVLGYLLFDDDDDDPSLNVAALETQNAGTRAALDSESTLIADAAAAQTATADGEAADSAESTEEQEESDPTSVPDDGEADPTEVETDSNEEATEPASESESTEETTDDGETDGSSTGDPSVSELDALQPGVDAFPAGIDLDEDISLELDDVISALGGSRAAEQNLEEWGWFGNSGRAWSPSDASVLEEGATTSMNVSIHGFEDSASAAEALIFFTDILVTSGYEEGEPPELGESSRILSSEGDDGVIVALYVQQDGVMYRFGGFAPPGGDPTADVINLASETVPAGE